MTGISERTVTFYLLTISMTSSSYEQQPCGVKVMIER